MNTKQYFKIGWMILLLTLILPFSAYAAEEIGKITRLKGTAEILREGVLSPIVAAVDMPVELLDRIETDTDSNLRISLIDGSILSLGEEAQLDLAEFEFDPEEKKRDALFKMGIGKVRVFANDLVGFRERDFHVQTPTAVCGIRGTLFMVWVVSDTITRVVCFKNEIEVYNIFRPEEIVVLTPNQSTDVVLKEAPTTPMLMKPEQFQQLRQDLGLAPGTVRPTGTEAPVAPPVAPEPRRPMAAENFVVGVPEAGNPLANAPGGVSGGQLEPELLETTLPHPPNPPPNH